MKNKFEAPELELNVFSVEDVVTASATGGLTGSEAGDGDSGAFGELFGKNG
jgi:hypothetical protein